MSSSLLAGVIVFGIIKIEKLILVKEIRRVFILQKLA